MRRVFPILVLLLAGCATSEPGLLDNDPDVVRKPEAPLGYQVLLAPVTVPDIPAEDPLHVTDARAGDLAFNTLKESEVFFGVFPPGDISPTPRDRFIQEAAGKGADLVLEFEIARIDCTHAGRNSMWVPNLLLWLTLFAPSIWVADQTYRVDADITYQMRNTQDGEIVYKAEFTATTHVDLDYLDRKVPWLGLWPWDRGVLLWDHEDTEEGMDSIRERVRPHAIYQMRKDFLIQLRRDFYREATRPDFEKRLYPEGDPGKEMALVIGVSDYEDPTLRCRFGERDATRFRDDFLRKRKGNDLTDNSVKFLIGEEATRERIGLAMVKTLGGTQHRRRISVYFSGFGAASPRPDGGYDFYLLPWDASTGDLAGSALSLRELQGWMDQARADEVILVIDAGFGATDVGKSAPRVNPPAVGERKAFLELAQQFVRDREGRAVFLAGRPGDQVSELESNRSGLLTFVFLDFAGGRADSDGDGKVTLDEMKVLQDKVEWEAGHEERAQVPLILGDAKLVICEP